MYLRSVNSLSEWHLGVLSVVETQYGRLAVRFAAVCNCILVARSTNTASQSLYLPLPLALALNLPSFHSGPGLCVWPLRTYNLTCPSAHSAFSGVLIFCCCPMLITPAAAAAVGRLNCLSLRQVRRFGVQLRQNTAILTVPLRQNATPENLLLH